MEALPPLVWMEWEDSAQAAPQWQWLTEISGPTITTCLSVGFLISDGEKEKRLAISVASREGKPEQAAGIIAIPASCIVRRGSLISSLGTTACDPAAESSPMRTKTESPA